MLKKIVAIAWLFSVCSFAITIADIEKSMKKSIQWSDTFEIRLSTKLESAAGTQVSNVYIVQKGQSKIYTELKMPMLNSRTIVSGNRMKVKDLQTGKDKVIPYDEKSLELMAVLNVPKITFDGWSNPEKRDGSEYVLTKENSELYYDSQKACVTRLIETLDEGYAEMLFEYDENNVMRKFVMNVLSNGINTKITTLIEKTGTGKDFPDRFFDF